MSKQHIEEHITDAGTPALPLEVPAAPAAVATPEERPADIHPAPVAGSSASLMACAVGPGGVALRSVGDIQAFAEYMGRAQMLPRGVTPPMATIAIIAGIPIGLNPFQAVQGITPINGRPAIWGDAMVAVVKASGLVADEKVEWFTDGNKQRIAVRYSVWRKGEPTPHVGEFGVASAKAAGLWGKQGPWTFYPTRMMLCRARAFALRDGFADVLKGMACAEEVIDEGVTVTVADAQVVPKSNAGLLRAAAHRKSEKAPEAAPADITVDVPPDAAPVPVAQPDAK